MWTMVRVSAVLLVLFTNSPEVAPSKGTLTECPGAAADIAFLLDGSGSVSSSDFNTMKTFVKSMIRSLLGLGQATQFAVAQYSTNSIIHYHFDTFATSGSWESQIDSIKQQRGWTYTAKAIQHVVKDVFVGNRGLRPNVNKFLIVITDGESNDRKDLPNAASLAAREGIIRFTIGVGSAFSKASAKADLDIIATDPLKHVFQVTNFQALEGIMGTLQNNICPVEEVAPSKGTLTECPGAAADIALLLDGSGSVSSSDFNTMKTFIKSMIHSLLGLGQATQFAVAQYSTNSIIHYHFDTFATSGSWESQIDSIKQQRGWTYTAKAIQHVVKDVFVGNRGLRPNVNKFLIVITDGESTDRKDLPNAASLAAREGIIRFTIGVGSAFSKASAKADLDIIATNPLKHVFQVTNFQALEGIMGTLQNNICPVEVATTTPTTITTPDEAEGLQGIS